MNRMHMYSESWYAEESKETERLNLAGVSEQVYEDCIQQVMLGDVNWHRQTRILTLSGLPFSCLLCC